MSRDLTEFQKFLESISNNKNTHTSRARRRKMERAIKKYNVNDGKVSTDRESET